MNTVISEKIVGEKDLKVSFEDIGGLHKEIQRTREVVELSLKYPQIFQRMGMDVPKGVLLYGPVGCGKTLVAKAVAREAGAYFIHLSGLELVGMSYIESEKRLIETFEKGLSKAPSIIFIDEIDAIAPLNKEMVDERQMERRTVAQLLALMDSIESRSQVVVIGTVNNLSTLDPALQRQGIFDRQISIGIPDKKERFEILRIHTRGMPLAKDINIEKLAQITRGFVGADLKILCWEAAMSAMRNILPNINFQLNEIPYDLFLEIEVSMEDFLEAYMEVEPSTIKEIFAEIPDVKWEDVGGLDDFKQKLKESVEWPLKYPQLFEKAKIKLPKGIMICGPAGTGKTLLAKAVAHESSINFISIKGLALLSKNIVEAERELREAFKKAKNASPCILFFDEIDALFTVKGSNDTEAYIPEQLACLFLNLLDGLEELKGVIVLSATDRLETINSVLFHPGRFDIMLELPFPDEKTRLEIFEINTRGKPLAEKVNLKALTHATSNFVGSDIEFVCHKASLFAIREYMTRDDKDFSTFEIKVKHFNKAIKEVTERKEGLK